MKTDFIFADISGFTQLTEEFIENSRYGAEHITDMLSSVFSPSIDHIYKNGGYVLLFAGDAMLFCVPSVKRHAVERSIVGFLNDYNEANGRNLGISFETPGEQYYPHIIECYERKFVFFHENRTALKYKDIKDNINIAYPPEILQIKERHFSGELATLPVFFINMREKNLNRKIRRFYSDMIDRADKMGIYINKIEYADKGGMILISAGAPKFMEKAPVKCVDFLIETMEDAERKSIKIAAGGTLGKCYAGIIGTDRRWEYTFIGSNVNLAARIAVKTDTGRIFADLKLRNYLRKYFSTRFIDEIPMKGIDKPVSVYQIENRTDAKAHTIITDEALINQSVEHIQEPLSIISLQGGGGTGKSVFLNDLTKRIKWCTASVKAFREDMPYSVLERILKDSNLRKNLIKQNLGSDTVKAFRSLGNSIKENMVIIIDDCHNLSNEDIEELKKASFKRNNINYIFCSRPHDSMEFLHSQVCKYEVQRIDMRGFDRNRTKQYIEKRTGSRISTKYLDKIQSMSDGNPLFITEIINFMMHEDMIDISGKYIKFKTDISKIPYSISELILSKFKEMNARERSFLKTGSLIGEQFKVHVPAALNDFDKQEISHFLKAAENINILNPSRENTIAFYHSMVRETIYDIMLFKEIRALAEKIGNMLAESNEPEDMLQSGYFYQLSDNARAPDMYLRAAEGFVNTEQYNYALHAYKNFLKVNPGSTVFRQSFNVFRHISRHKMDGEAIDLFYKRAVRYKNLDKDIVLLIADLLINILGDTKRARHILDKHREQLEKEVEYMLTIADIDAKEQNIDNAVRIYDRLKKRQFKNDNERMKFFAKYGQFSFIMISSKKRTEEALEITNSLKNKVRDRDGLTVYYNFLITVYLHRNYMKKAKKAADKLMEIAIETNNEDIKASMYNTYSIIYSAIAWEKKNAAYQRKAFEYAKKMMDIMLRDMNLNALPLMTSNLALSYLKRGDIERGMSLLYDSLAYGREINHPIEVPYTMSLIGYFSYLQGDFETAVKMSEGVMKDYPMIDMRGLAGMLLFILKNDSQALKEARRMNESCARNGHFMPYTYYYSALFYHSMISGSKDDMKELRNELKDFTKRAKLRPASETGFRTSISICDIMSGSYNKSSVRQLRNYSLFAEKMNLGGNVVASGYIALSKISQSRNDKIKNLRRAYFITKQYKLYPLMKSIIHKYIELDYNAYYYKTKLKEWGDIPQE